MAHFRSMLLVTATVATAMLSRVAFVQVPVMTRAGRLGKFQMRGAATEDVATDTPDTGKNSRGPAVLGAFAALGLLAGLLAPQGTTAFIDAVSPVSSNTSSMTRTIFTGVSEKQVEKKYVSMFTGVGNDSQFPMFPQKTGDQSRFLESASEEENRLQENAGQLGLEEAACYPGFC